jgi:hypothetical protein
VTNTVVGVVTLRIILYALLLNLFRLILIKGNDKNKRSAESNLLVNKKSGPLDSLCAVALAVAT